MLKPLLLFNLIIFNAGNSVSAQSTNIQPEALINIQNIERHRYWLGLKDVEANDVVNQILIAYMTGATNGFDNQIDAKRILGGSNSIYAIINSEAYVIEGRALPFTTNDVVKLGLEIVTPGTYEITIQNFDGLFALGQKLFLYDKYLNRFHSLSDSHYTFDAELGVFNDRFEIHYINDSDITRWNGSTWSNGEPNESKKIIVNGALELNTDVISKELTINDGGSIIVKTGKTLNVSGKITNNSTADKFVLENGGNVLQQTNESNIGNFTVHRTSNAMVRNDMTFWSSPVTGQNVRSFSPETLENRFWTYNENINQFTQLFTTEGENKASSSYNFEPGKGVSIRVRNTLPTGQSEAFAGTFVGNLNNGDIYVPVEKTTDGYNLVGNPYASSINSDQFFNLNPQISALYFWTHNYPVGHQNYNLNYEYYTSAGSSRGDLSNIASGQGFIVKTSTAGNILFNNSLRNSSNALFNREYSIEKNRYWLELRTNDEAQNQILIAYMTGATNDFDHQIDAQRIHNGGNQIYTLIDNNAYAIQGRQLPFNTEDVVKLGLEVADAGTLSISLNAFDGFFGEGQEVYILDKSTNTIHNLSASAYQFESEAGTFNERFEILYTNRNLSTTDLNSADIKVYKNGGTFVVESAKTKINSVELVDVQGRKLFIESNLNTNLFEVNTVAKGILIIKVATEDGQIKTQKVIN